MNSFNPELQFKDTESTIKNMLIELLTTLVLELKKIESNNKTLHRTIYLHSKAETIINESNFDDAFKSIFSTVISNTQKFLEQSSGWIINSVIGHKINISKCNLRLATVISHCQNN